MAKAKEVKNIMSPMLAAALGAAKKNFGASNAYQISQHRDHIIGIPCPMAWGWFVGGTNIVPLRRAIGVDGMSGSYKSFLMMEHARWFLMNGGNVVLVDTEEKVSDTMFSSLLQDLPPEIRVNFVYQKVASLQKGMDAVTHYRKYALEASKQIDDPKSRMPLLIIWDSLTGKDSVEVQAKINTEGHAKSKAFSDQASAIARYYKNLVFDSSLVTLAHVQHTGKNMDPNAYGDDEYVSKGGDEPRYQATYHTRTLFNSDIATASYQGKALTMKAIKAGLGQDKRRLKISVKWSYRRVYIPKSEKISDVEYNVELSEAPMTYGEARDYYNETQGALDPYLALELRSILNLDDVDPDAPPPDNEENFAKWPVIDREEDFQCTWFDWDEALGKLIYEMKYSEKKLPKARLDDLSSFLHFTEVDTKNVKCEQLFGDDKKHSHAEFGKALQADPEMHEKLSVFLGIVPYNDYREAEMSYAETASDVKRRKQAVKIPT